MAVKHSQARERVTMDDDGSLLIPDALLAELTDSFGQRIDVPAELTKAEAWVAANITRRKGDHTRVVRSWLLRAAAEAECGRPLEVGSDRPVLRLLQGGGQPDVGKCRAVLALVCVAPKVGA